jgi:hypothetical protein
MKAQRVLVAGWDAGFQSYYKDIPAASDKYEARRVMTGPGAP